jgi:hypothetical protein
MHGEYKKGSELSNFEKILLPENTRKYLTKTYRSEGEAYKAVKFLEAC